MTLGELAGAVCAVAAAAAVLGGAIAAYLKLSASINALGTKIAVLDTKLTHVLKNDLPHIKEKVDGIAEEQKNRLEKCVTHDHQLENLGSVVTRLQDDAGN